MKLTSAMSDAVPAAGKAMSPARLLELETIANFHNGKASAGYMLELIQEVRRLSKRSAKRAAFTPPMLSDVEAYFADGDVFKNGVVAEKAAEFIAFYSARGWKLSKGVPMVCWKSACDLWESNARQKAAVGPALNRQTCAPLL
jgi:hypothetical protein